MPDNAIAAEVNPNAGFDRLNAVIGLKGGLLGLEAKRQALAGQAAEVQQKQLDTQASQGASDYFSAHPMRDYHDEPDGTLGVNAFTVDHPDFQKLPGNVQQRVLGLAMGIKSKQLENAQAFQNLTASENSFAQSQLGAVASTDDAQRLEASIKAGKPDLDAYAKVKAAAAATMDRLENSGSQGLANVSKTYRRTANAGPADIVPAFRAINATAASAAERFPRMGMNAEQRPFVIQPTTGAVSGATGVNYGPGGVTPSAPAVAGATTRATGTGNIDLDKGKEVADMQRDASAGVPLTKRIDELSHEINSGHLAKMISESGNYLGFASVNEARSQLIKDLGQVRGAATKMAGSDARMATILEGYPTDTTPENTTHAAMDYIRGTFRQTMARGRNLMTHQARDPGLSGFQSSDTLIANATNPLHHEYMSLPPEQQAAFLKRNFSSKDAAQAFLNETKGLKQHKVLD